MKKETPNSAAEPKSRKAEIIGFALLTLFWWGGISFFVASTILLPGGKYLHAKLTYSVTNATILTSTVSFDAGADGGCTFSPAIEYSYTVDGEEYTSDTFDHTVVGRNNHTKVKAMVAQYPVGQDVPVYFDPDDPQKALLSMTRPHLIIALSLFSLPFLFVGVALLVGLFHSPRRSRKLLAGEGNSGKQPTSEPNVAPGE